MATTNGSKPWGLGTHILEYRLLIGLTLIAITAFMGYWALRVQIATRFENFFPGQHIDTQLYQKFHYQYGGAQQLLVMLRVKRGDIFNFKTLHKIQDMHDDVNRLPGVDHNSIFSHHDRVASIITYDNKGLLVTAGFNERRLDYKALFDAVNEIIHKYQDDNTEIYVAGQPMISGWGYFYLPRISAIFATSIALMLVILYMSLGQRSSWWAPIVTGSFSAIWGLGFVSLMGYDFDPVMLVIPFILTARDLSHGIQWQGRYYDELDRLDDKLLACATTTDVMLP